MNYEGIKDKKAKDFKRLTGLKKKTFHQMLEVVNEAEARKVKLGRESKLSVEDQLLLTLSYWREYRTQFHIAASYGIHESTANRIINKIEDVLMASGKFRLPKKRTVQETDWIVVMVDATEVPIERPKKTAQVLLRQEKVSQSESTSHHRC